MARRNAKKLGGVEHRIYSFKEYIGFTLDETVEVMGGSFERGGERVGGACSYCGVWRRWLLNYAARDVEADKLAVGHNLDDEVQMFLMNLLRGGT